jgi:hypothetical protein
MKSLCLAYGDEKDWVALSPSEQEALLAQDEVLRERGDVVASVEPGVAVVRAWDGRPTVTSGPIAHSILPLAGFSLVEAADLEQAIALVANTPCARAQGAIEVRAIGAMNDLG